MINYYHYSSPFLILFFHIFSFLLVPFILHVINLGDVIPKLAYELNLDYYLYKMEPALVCLAVGTAYYVIFEIVFDVLQACRRWKPVLYDVDTHQTLVREEHPVFFTRLNMALRQLRQTYPRK
ncbi:MAG: hypothetical protein EXX96DRAFT_343319 [Benjaminiella poitrasii]|nr:MAG: hypothetical protein EXX96DRAFT_343319 [Benjaminiella poitrasii]